MSKIKNIRQFDDVLSRGAYIWIVVSIIALIYSIKTQKRTLMVISVFSIVFGIITQTGMFEMSTYRGRSGWYLLLFAIIGSVLLLDIVIKKIPLSLTYSLIGLLLIASFVRPPTFYRTYYTEPYIHAKYMSEVYPDKNILFLTRDKNITLVGNNISYKPLFGDIAKTPCLVEFCFLVLEDVYLDLDPVLSQKAVSSDTNFSKFKVGQKAAKAKNDYIVGLIKKSPGFKNYQLFWTNNKVSIYLHN